MYVLSDDLGDELRDAQMLLAAAIHGEKRLRQMADAEPTRSGTVRSELVLRPKQVRQTGLSPEAAPLLHSEVT